MRGISSERQLGAFYDLDRARQGLTNAIVAYLEPREPRAADGWRRVRTFRPPTRREALRRARAHSM